MRKEFEMSEEDLAEIGAACKPVPYLVAGGMPPESPQSRANRAWQTLGSRLGFDGMTVRPVDGKGPRFFTAEAIGRCPPGCPGIDLGDGNSSGCECTGEGCDCPNHAPPDASPGQGRP